MAEQSKWALILGGSSGLGWATAQKLAGHGWSLILLYRERRSDEDKLLASVEKLKQSGSEVICYNKDALKTDVQQQIADDLLKKKLDGKINLLVHSIAKGSLKPLTGENKLTHQDIQLTIQAMALSFYDWAQLLIDRQLVNRPARFIAFTSEGSHKVWPGYAAVGLAKSVLETLMKYMAQAFSCYEININCLSPGLVETRASMMIPGFEQLKDSAEKRNPQKRLTQAKDAADAVYLLTQNEAAWLNGCVIPVDGGEHLQ